MTMSVALAVSQASHLLSTPVTPVPLTQLPQRKPVVEREGEAAQDSIRISMSILEHAWLYTLRQLQVQLHIPCTCCITWLLRYWHMQPNRPPPLLYILLQVCCIAVEHYYISYLVCYKCTAGPSWTNPETQWTCTLPHCLCTTAGSGSNHGNSLWWTGPWYHLSWWWECPTASPAWDEGGGGLMWEVLRYRGKRGNFKRMGDSETYCRTYDRHHNATCTHSTLTLSNTSSVFPLQLWMFKSILEHWQTYCPGIIPCAISNPAGHDSCIRVRLALVLALNCKATSDKSQKSQTTTEIASTLR